MMTLPHDVKGLMAHITKQVCIYIVKLFTSVYTIHNCLYTISALDRQKTHINFMHHNAYV